MVFNEFLQFASIIEKLLPGWIDFKNYLKHKKKEMTMEELVVHLHIEEDNQMALKKDGGVDSLKVHMVKVG